MLPIRKIIYSLALILGFTPGFTYQKCNYLNFEAGYRWDRLYDRVIVFGNNGLNGAAGEFFRDINSAQVGGTAQWTFCNSFFLRERGHYAEILRGEYDEAFTFGKIDGNLWDVAFSLGSWFCFYPCWSVAPLIGWAYDALNFTAVNVKTFRVRTPSGDPSLLGDVDCRSSFQGPWIGFNILFEPNRCINFLLSYELHRVWWNGNHILDAGNLGSNFGPVTGFSDRRDHNKIWGNRFELTGEIRRYCHLHLGIGLIYQFYKSQNIGNYSRLNSSTEPPSTKLQKVIDVDWQSFSALVRLGYDF